MSKLERCRALIVFASTGLAACRNQPAPVEARVDAPAPAPASTASVTGLAALAHSAEPPHPVLDVGPDTDAGAAAEELAAYALLGGALKADTLPEIATEPGESLDVDLRDKLAPVRSLGGLGDLERKRIASIGAVQAPDSITNAARAVAGMRAGFRRCYGLGLLQNPEATGAVQVTLRVDESGAVTSAQLKASRKQLEPIVPCMKSRASAAQFDASSKKGDVRFTVTLEVQTD
jgi:hypothetical protein